MLRGLLLAVLLANLVFFVWARGGFGGSTGAGIDSEPERLARQVRPEALQLLTPAPVIAAAESAASVPAASASEATAAVAAVAAASAASAALAADPVASAASADVALTAATTASAPLVTAAVAAASTSPAQAPTASAAGALATAAVPATPVPAPVKTAVAAGPVAPPGTRCFEAGPYSGLELAGTETALAANASTRRIARRWVAEVASAASASVASGPQHRLRIDATPAERAVLESLPASLLGKSLTPCASR